MEFWSFGVLLGIVGVSTVAEASVLAFNSSNISESVNAVFESIGQKVLDYVNPHFETFKNGAQVISITFYGWARDVVSSGIIGWLRTQEFRNLSSGFQVLIGRFKEWSAALNGIIESVWSKKAVALDFLNKDKFVQALVGASRFSSEIKASLSVILGALFMAMQHSLSPSSQDVDEESQNAANSLKSLFSSGKFIDFLKSAWSVVSENPEAIKGITGDQMKQLLTYATQNVDVFISRIEVLKSQGSWGKYKTSVELINAILNNSWGNITVNVLNWLFSPFSSCRVDSCNESDIFLDTVEAFVDVFKAENTLEG